RADRAVRRPDRGGDGAVRRGGRAAGDDPGGEPAGGGGDRGGDRDRHGAVPDGRAPVLVGGDVAGPQREGPQAAERPDDQGERRAARDAGAGGLGGQPHQGDRPVGAVSEVGGAAGEEAGGSGAGA